VLWGRDLARRYLCDIERVLRPKRALLVLNYSYSGDWSVTGGILSGRPDH